MAIEQEGFPLQNLVALLSSDTIVSLEILPGGLEEWTSAEVIGEYKRPTPGLPFLFYDGNLGIPKRILYELYIAAVSLFKSSRSVPQMCIDATCIILLANPAHQTALNARKRLVQHGNLDPKKELRLIEILIRGSSDCSKQSILWDHRRWLFHLIYTKHVVDKQHNMHKWTASADIQPLPNLPPQVIQHELSIVRASCEAYPRNYHAWSHWHFIVEVLTVGFVVRQDFSEVCLGILTQEFNTLRNWIEHHVSDHSAAYHLCSLGRLFHDLALDDSFSGSESIKGGFPNDSLSDHALSLVESYPSHESLWIYLRESFELLPYDKKQSLMRRIKSSPVSRSLGGERFIAWTHFKLNPSGEGRAEPRRSVDYESATT